VELNKGQWPLLALGMAEYRNGHFDAANEALLAVSKVGNDLVATATAELYHALILYQQGKKEEARELATKAVQSEPLTKGDPNPLLKDSPGNQMVLRAACKEAKALIGFDTPPAEKPKPEGDKK
jgi:tetratricopeptide (TPR) repeat protein